MIAGTSETFNHQSRAAVHRNATVFEQAFDHILLPQKFHDDIPNGLTVIALTYIQTHPQTDTAENNTTFATLSLRGW